jgi:hypothetical protein
MGQQLQSLVLPGYAYQSRLSVFVYTNPRLAIIYYTMKYISNAEENTHSKLTIAAAVARALKASNNNSRDQGKSMLIKTYNKLSSHREVGIPEAISHSLDYPDVFDRCHI